MSGGIGALLIGMMMLSDNMKKLSNTRFEAIFNKAPDSKLVGVGMGAAATAVVQSSSITTVMVVGLVNAGMITLFQATTIIMGANVGTTITAHIASLQSFNFGVYAMFLAFVGVFMTMLMKREKTRTIGKVLSGLGMIFVGLYLLGASMSNFKENPEVVELISSISNPVLLLLIGAGLTALFQSSSAITSIVISMAIAGLVIGKGGNDPLYIILGSNIGTTITTLISSIGANTNAKRASLIHFMFNVIGSLIFIALLLLWPTFNQDILAKMFKNSATQIAMFHTFFNISCAALFLPFTFLFVKVSERIIKDKPNGKGRVVILDERLLKTPGIAINQLRIETKIMADYSMKALSDSFEAFLKKDVLVAGEIRETIRNVEQMNTQIIFYLVKLSGESLNIEEQVDISVLYTVINDLSRISDLSDNMLKYTEYYVEEQLNFSGIALSGLNDMFEIIKQLHEESMKVFLEPHDKERIKLVDSLEDKVDAMREHLINDHIDRLNKGACSPLCSPILVNLVSNLERAADHMTFIAHARD